MRSPGLPFFFLLLIWFFFFFFSFFLPLFLRLLRACFSSPFLLFLNNLISLWRLRG
jgi:hypothetical protein